jgi:hypothetical protein
MENCGQIKIFLKNCVPKFSLEAVAKSMQLRVLNAVFQVLKPNIHARITGLPMVPELMRETLPKTADLRRLLLISGTSMTLIHFPLYGTLIYCPKSRGIAQRTNQSVVRYSRGHHGCRSARSTIRYI